MWDKERKCWRIVTGESRWRAAKLAGLATVPCVPVEGELSETDMLADQIVENHCRNDLRPLDLARAMAKLKKLKACTSQDLAAELGISGASVTRAEALLTLPEDVQAMVDDGRLAESAAYEISRLKDEDAMRELASQIVASRLNRDQVIEAVRLKVGKKNVQPKAGRVAGKLDGVSFSFSFASGELTPETLLAAIEKIRSQAQGTAKGRPPRRVGPGRPAAGVVKPRRGRAFLVVEVISHVRSASRSLVPDDVRHGRRLGASRHLPVPGLVPSAVIFSEVSHAKTLGFGHPPPAAGWRWRSFCSMPWSSGCATPGVWHHRPAGDHVPAQPPALAGPPARMARHGWPG